MTIAASDGVRSGGGILPTPGSESRWRERARGTQRWRLDRGNDRRRQPADVPPYRQVQADWRGRESLMGSIEILERSPRTRMGAYFHVVFMFAAAVFKTTADLGELAGQDYLWRLFWIVGATGWALRMLYLADRDLAVGHVDVQLVADPGVAVSLAVLLRADIAVGRQVVEHLRQGHGGLAFEPCAPLRSFFSLLRPSPLALGKRRRLLLDGRLLAGLDGRRVAGEMAHQLVAVGLADQRFVHALGQLRAGEFGEGAREDRLARHLAPPLPAAEAPERHVGVQAVQQHARGRHVVDRLGHECPRQRGAVARRTPRRPELRGNPLLDADDLQGLHQLLLLRGQWPQLLLQIGKQRILNRLPVGGEGISHTTHTSAYLPRIPSGGRRAQRRVTAMLPSGRTHFPPASCLRLAEQKSNSPEGSARGSQVSVEGLRVQLESRTDRHRQEDAAPKCDCERTLEGYPSEASPPGRAGTARPVAPAYFGSVDHRVIDKGRPSRASL